MCFTQALDSSNSCGATHKQVILEPFQVAHKKKANINLEVDSSYFHTLHTYFMQVNSVNSHTQISAYVPKVFPN